MSRFLLGALAMGAVFALTSFAVRPPANPVLKKDGPAWTVSDYRLDRAFRTQLQLTAPMTAQVPSAGGGLIITQFAFADPGNTGSAFSITVNGVQEIIDICSFQSPWAVHDLNPPIILRPNDIVTLTPLNGSPKFTIAGYNTYPGET